MKKDSLKVYIQMLMIMMFAFLTGCGGEKTPIFSVSTDIRYSAGDSKEWAYGNQQKEFPGDENCYVRIDSIALTDIKEGIDTELSVVYRFTCNGEFHIELADGIATQTQNAGNVIEYTRTVLAQKEGEEDIVIFQYVPQGGESVVLEIFYDDQVDARYDERNTVYFSGVSEEIQNSIH